MKVPRIVEELDLMERVDHENAGVPISELLSSTDSLPAPDRVETEEKAEKLLDTLVDELETLGIVIDFCGHWSERRAYRYVLQTILRKKYDRRLVATSIVTHFTTYQDCRECDEEFDLQLDESEIPS